ncbi:hypothetical protein KIN20_018006 [Parelaphostrongylus tenuis]|uniref:Uncharacterized protein n=1 Tax=Parelaphostrongylus tenuis TaxID=148309 RepID=A0AAD5MP61_PARTN|nr:hypothetical protein KIN20_018006 [Parelaphostrongylus tenuis]
MHEYVCLMGGGWLVGHTRVAKQWGIDRQLARRDMEMTDGRRRNPRTSMTDHGKRAHRRGSDRRDSTVSDSK